MNQALEQPEPVQEPVGKWMGKCIEWTENPYKFKKGQSIYTTPPAQPAAWVGLTPEQIRACFFAGEPPASSPPHWWEYRNPDYIAIYSNIADKLREKNGGA